MSPRHPSIGYALCLTLAAVSAPSLAHAQLVERLSLSGHVSVSTVLTDPYPSFADLGVGAELRPSLRLVGPLHVQLLAGLQFWPVYGQLASLTPVVGVLRFGGGLRVAPTLSERFGGPFVDADLAAAITTGAPQVTYALGAGWLVPLARAVSLGPAVRVGYSDVPDNPYGFSSFWYLTVGVEVALRIPRSTPLPPPLAAATPARANVDPDPDPDHDGVSGAADRCPTEPETVNGFEEADGCPDNPDADGDGVLGAADRCPGEPETRNSFEDDDGCPDDSDADHDDVALPADRCPDQAETRNEYQDDDGCPDAPPPVQVAGARITVNGTILFETQRDRILPESFGLLDGVVAVLQSHAEIRRIRIEGHTDAQGSARRNRTLSARRARAVERYFRDHGVDRGRLTAEGFGADRPIATGHAPEDDARNRRVEFYIVDPAGGVSATGSAPGTPAATTAAAPEGDGEPGRHRRHGRQHRRAH